MNSIRDRSSTERLPHVPSGTFRSPHFAHPTETDNRQELVLASGPFPLDEALVVDSRASLRPAQLVERKLMSLLKSVYLPVSHVRTTALCKARGPFSVPSAPSDRKLNDASPAVLRAPASKRESRAAAPV